MAPSHNKYDEDYEEIPNDNDNTLPPGSPELELLQPTAYVPRHLLPAIPKPTIVLIPSAWHTPVHYARLTGRLVAQGYDTRCPQLPTAGASQPNKSLAHDVWCVTALLTDLVEKRGKEVVLILHGDGGVPGSVAARGFLKREMVGKGRKGRVVAMLYMNAWALPAGVSKADFVRENPGWKRDWLRVEGGYAFPSNAQHHLYNDLHRNEADYHTAKLVTYWIAGATEPLPADCAGGVVPIAYLICENDNAIPVFIQEKFAKNLGEGCEIVRCDAGHCPFLSQADKVVELVVGLAEEYGAKEKE